MWFKTGALSRVEKQQLVKEGMAEESSDWSDLKVVCIYNSDGIVYWYMLLKLFEPVLKKGEYDRRVTRISLHSTLYLSGVIN